VTKVTAWADPRWVSGAPADHVAGDSRLTRRLQLFAAAAEDERIAALQAHDVQPFLGEGHQHAVDFVLAVGVPRLALGHRNPPRRRRGQVEDLVGDQAVMHHDLGALQRLERLDRQQLRITGAGAHQPDRAGPGERGAAQGHQALSRLRPDIAVGHGLKLL
jgi:hypothetical protein